MIYLIGGPPKCGKTTLAKYLFKEHQIPWVSTDTLEGIAYAYITNDRAQAFPHSYLKGETHDQTYAEQSTGEIMQGYIDQSKTAHAGVKAFIESELADGNDYSIEGYHITPAFAQEMVKEFEGNVKAVCIIKTDEEKLLQNFAKSTTPNDWVLRAKKPETLEKIAKMISLYGKWFENESQKNNVPCHSMDEDFEEKLKTISRTLLS